MKLDMNSNDLGLIRHIAQAIQTRVKNIKTHAYMNCLGFKYGKVDQENGDGNTSHRHWGYLVQIVQLRDHTEYCN